jgi:hypothetical protein
MQSVKNKIKTRSHSINKAKKSKKSMIYQSIVLFVDIKIFNQSITQKIIESTDTVLEIYFKTNNK